MKTLAKSESTFEECANWTHLHSAFTWTSFVTIDEESGEALINEVGASILKRFEIIAGADIRVLGIITENELVDELKTWAFKRERVSLSLK